MCDSLQFPDGMSNADLKKGVWWIYIYIYLYIVDVALALTSNLMLLYVGMMREIPPWHFSLEGTPPTFTAISDCIEVVGWGKLGEGQDPGPH